MPREETATPVAIEPEGDWYGLYKGSTSRDDHLFEPASVRHPAKMSLALTNKILDTMQEWGWIETGSLVVDPFGGRGTTALCWISRHPANRALTVELEPHFVEMQQKNKEHAERRLHRELAWVILQGDSRRFAEYYAEGKAASILSPPYEAQSGGTGPASEKGYMAERGMQQYHAASNTNLGYAEGKAASVLSAPYGPKGVHDHDAEREARFAEARGRTKESVQQYIEGDYGSTPGQIGNLPDVRGT
jgi:16S rRNA G966 N2-methylase RsmD